MNSNTDGRNNTKTHTETTEPCAHCGKPVNISAPFMAVHLTVSGKVVALDYAGDDSQGEFALGPVCATKRKYAKRAFLSQPW